MNEKTRQSFEKFKEIIQNVGKATGKALEGLEESTKKIDEVLKKVEGTQ
jgi:archaellum component FlaC